MQSVPSKFARAVLVLCLAAGWAIACSQQGTLPSVTQPPPHIIFSDWKEVPSEEGVSEYTLSFPSAIQTKYAENNQVPVRLVFPSEHDKALPIVVVLHYWGATDLSAENELARE